MTSSHPERAKRVEGSDTAIKAVLFDIDGTILDTHNFVFGAVDYTFKKHGLSISKEKLAEATGKHLVEFYKLMFPNKDFELFSKTHREFQENNFNLVKLFPKVKTTLEKLKSQGFLIAAVSNRSRKGLIKSLEMHEVDKLFDVIVASDDVQNPKPHKDHPEKALEILGVEKELAIMVGDTENDILAGKSAGIKTVGVTYGWMGEDIKLQKPDYIINDIEGLLKLLK